MDMNEFFDHFEAITIYEDIEYAEHKDIELQRIKQNKQGVR